VAGVVGTLVVRRLRRRGALVVAAAGVAVGCLALTLVGPLPATLAVALLIGLGGSTIVQVVAPALSEHHRGRGASVLSEMNAVASTLGLTAPLLVGAGVALGVTWRPAMLLPVLLMAASCVLILRLAPEPAIDGAGGPDPGPRAPAGPLPRAFWALALVLMCCVAVEFCMTTWSADLLRERAHLPPAGASAGVSAVVGGMAVGRLVIGRLALRLASRVLLLGALVTALGGWAVAWTTTTGLGVMTGLVLTGLGIAGLYPLGVALVMGATPGQEDQASAWLSGGISIAIGAAPFAMGALADVASTHTAFLVVPGLLLAALTISLLNWRRAAV
jgi:predicted MFS family arabinose efflux permease